MNINNLKFAKLVSYLTSLMANGECLQEHQIMDINDLMISCCEPAKVAEEEINNLLASMGRDGQKIPAIKAYRTLTGTGLKEAKDAVEKYWVAIPSTPAMDASVKFGG